MHRRGNLQPVELTALLAGEGFTIAEQGPVGFRSIQNSC
jgi:hypothetical protein